MKTHLERPRTSKPVFFYSQDRVARCRSLGDSSAELPALWHHMIIIWIMWHEIAICNFFCCVLLRFTMNFPPRLVKMGTEDRRDRWFEQCSIYWLLDPGLCCVHHFWWHQASGQNFKGLHVTSCPKKKNKLLSHQVCFTLGNCVPHCGAVADSVVLCQKCLATSRLDCTRLLMLRTRVIFPLSAVDDAHQWLLMTFYGLRFVILCMYVGCLMGPTDGRPSTFTAPRLLSKWFPCVYEANSTWRWRQNFAQKLCPLCPTIKPSSMSYLANFAISWHIFIFSS